MVVYRMPLIPFVALLVVPIVAIGIEVDTIVEMVGSWEYLCCYHVSVLVGFRIK
jgi:hypothetical protein